MHDSAKVIYYMILDRDLLTALGSNIKLPDQVIEAYDGPFEGSTETMVDLGNSEFKR